MVQHVGLLKADSETEVLGCIREAVDDVFLRMDEKGAVDSKQQLSS